MIHQLNIAVALIGGLLLLLGLFSSAVSRELNLSEPLIALLFGALIGPQVLALVQLPQGHLAAQLFEQAARFTLAVALVGVALRITRDFYRHHWRELLGLLLVLMCTMWLTSSLLAWTLLPVPALTALLLGAIATPTDPVVASAIVSGPLAEERIPARLRQLLSGESGSNDGLTYPFVLLPLLLMERGVGPALLRWGGHVWLWQVGGAIVAGGLLGLLTAKLLCLSERTHSESRISVLTVSIALSLTTLAATGLLGTDGVLAAFAAGIAFRFGAPPEELAGEERIQEAIARFFNLPVFVLLGSAAPWARWLAWGWPGALFVGALLLLRRLPFVLLCAPQAPTLTDLADTLFFGWFGPIGVAALFYAGLATRQTGELLYWELGSLAVCASVVLHGGSAALGIKLYGRQQRARSSAGAAQGGS